MRPSVAPVSFLLGVVPLILTSCAGYGRFSLPAGPAGSGALQLRVSPDPEPVLSPGPAGEWDAVDVLNPSVVTKGGTYYNFYSGFDGRTWSTGLATSSDGYRWTKQGRVLAPGPAAWEGAYIAANGSALVSGDEFLYWYQAGSPPAIGLARSPDGHRWAKEPEPAVKPGPRGSWDERGVADPYVIRVGGRYFLYYLGQDRARRQRLGLARSDDGIRWQKLLTNPILELGEAGSFDENGLGEPAVWFSHDRYWMLYTGRDRREYRRIGQAWSVDGVHWNRLPADTVFAGVRPWNSRVVCDPSVLSEGGRLLVWYGGGDVAAPAENLHGQIGMATLEAVGANLSK
ncbi:MAG TPA: hypothetical protein VLH09_05675 [Bryobacteraceae bacterium]|nr:hypothetical protein [Bryobacteraceae bacterium]